MLQSWDKTFCTVLKRCSSSSCPLPVNQSHNYKGSHVLRSSVGQPNLLLCNTYIQQLYSALLVKVFNAVHRAVTSIITPVQSVACFIAAADSSTRWSVRCARVCTRVVFEESTRVLQCTERCFPLCTYCSFRSLNVLLL